MNLSFLLAHIRKDLAEILGKLGAGKPRAGWVAARTHGLNLAVLLAEKCRQPVVECPVCGWRGFRFRAVDDEYSILRDVQCPRCEACGRHRLLLLYLEKGAPNLLETPCTVLQIAPEMSLLRYFAGKPGVRVFLTDLLPPKLLPHGQPKFRTDLRRLALKDDCLDRVVCVHVLEHIDDDRAAVRELFRAVAPGGKAIFMVPGSGSLDRTVEYDPAGPLRFGHLRDYSPKDTPARLAPFSVTTILRNDFLAPEEWFRYGLHDYDFIFLAEKPR